MQIPLQITFRGVPRSPALKQVITEKISGIEHLYGRITGCRVVVERRHRRHRQGNLFQVRVQLEVPGAELLASTSPDAAHEHEDADVAVRDAFAAAARRLEDHARRLRDPHRATPPRRARRRASGRSAEHQAG